MTNREAGAAQLSAAALTQAAMRHGPGEFRPFDSPIRPHLQSLWEILHDDAPGLWPEKTRALTSPSSAMSSRRHNVNTRAVPPREPFSPSRTALAQPEPLASKRRHGSAAAKQRKATVVNVPSRWATSYLVLASLLKSQQALAMAINSSGYEKLSEANKTNNVQKIPNHKVFWSNALMLQELLQPFSYAIHQIKGDKPQCAYGTQDACQSFDLSMGKEAGRWHAFIAYSKSTVNV
jgi:hypothetical protein